jgi:hypothetical protein
VKFDAENPVDRAVLETARSWGVSPSRFLGEPKEDVTVYTRNETGDVVRSSTFKAREWTDEDVESALSLHKYENSLCPGCKKPMAECMAPENEFRYEAEKPVRCHACTTRASASEGYRESPHPSALFIPVGLKKENDDDPEI